jgi:RNA polymerase sigma-70 factor (TIGR02960 family)
MTDSVALLDAARAGDAAAFEQLVAPLRHELQAHCYRMLGSLHDAEDALQESLLRAWQGVGAFDERGFFRAWLYKIATNRCLTSLGRTARRELPVDLAPGTPVTEVAWLEAYPDTSPEDRYLERESIEIAYVAALQHLTGVQRAVLILREVLGFSAAEVADQLDTSVASVNSALQRARKMIDSSNPSQHSVLREIGDDGLAAIVARWVGAWERGDVNDIIAMMTEDARFSMPPLTEWYAGHDAIRDFLTTGPLQEQWRLLPTTANGQLAFATYMWDESAGRYVPGGLDVLSLSGDHVCEIVTFIDADFTEFGLPATLSR